MSVSVDSVLLGDIGATNARFSLLSNGNLSAISSFEVAKFEQFTDALAIFIKEHCRQTQIHKALLAIAGPVKGERVALTNSSWVIDISELQTVLGLQVRIINDFEAFALSLPSLTSTDLARIGGGQPELGAPMAVLGPGTGLGVACLVDRSDRQVVIASEGGHATLAPTCELASMSEHRVQYERLIEVFQAHDIGFFFYNGGGDSQDTAYKVSQIGTVLYPMVCVGIPKTVDNDLPITDSSPGFGSAAKYLATCIRETTFDLSSVSRTSTKVFALEVMGRHAGWLTAACALAADHEGDAPHVLLLPEIAFDEGRFMAKVEQAMVRYGHCVIAVSEGIKRPDGAFLSAGREDAFGHAQLGGVAPIITNLIGEKFGYKCHWAVADYLQRSARHIASATDVQQAYAVGRAAVEFAIAGKNAVMPAIRRLSDLPYRWDIIAAPLSEVANQEKLLPAEFISADGFGITAAARRYLAPLIAGEAYPPFKDGLPDYVRLQNVATPKKLTRDFAV